ncbi:uncharacterized protein TNIN_177731 [Trichonephila inaurata madagascariensis]|uniref:Mitochondrial import inner membrane translocase subunit Tim29 n=1 Tax=Trichonephila inaurata madagascariensis TaxID=2747483 RepID=A0A8X6X6Y5_9ARAC|nr:uncharacterized protein TNIN_177731 [Trichonephila inaurata madagascariensis]
MSVIAKRILTLSQSVTNRLLLIKQRVDQAPQDSRLYRWRLYYVGLFTDYKNFGLEIKEFCQNKPKKALLTATGLATFFGAMKTNPNEHYFLDQHVRNSSALIMVADPIRNPAAEEYVVYLNRCLNQGLLRRTSCLFFSIMWVADYHKDCNIYPTQCKYLRPDFLYFYKRIIDVGVFGTWINLKLKMKDYDINPNEWKESS